MHSWTSLGYWLIVNQHIMISMDIDVNYECLYHIYYEIIDNNLQTIDMCDQIAGLVTDSNNDCFPCEPGYFSEAGSNQCIACPSNQIQPNRQSESCLTCGSNVNSRDDTRTKCQCDIGFYTDDSSDSVDNDDSNILNCIPCPDGADCINWHKVINNGNITEILAKRY